LGFPSLVKQENLVNLKSFLRLEESILLLAEFDVERVRNRTVLILPAVVAAFNLTTDFCPHDKVTQLSLGCDFRPKPRSKHFEVNLEAQVLPSSGVRLIKRIPWSIDQISKPNSELRILILMLKRSFLFLCVASHIFSSTFQLFSILDQLSAKLFNLLV